MKYRPEVDGLRAIAIIPVILFHAGFEAFSGGFTGVDVFFVISGFLITSIIFAELDQEKFSIVKFYERRARRILPLLFFVLLSTLPFAWISLYQVDMIDYFESLMATSLFSSNFLFAYEADYFDTSVELKPLLHTWSLAVEEQYYVLFPLFMIFIWRFKLKSRVFLLLFLVGVMSFILSEYTSLAYPKYNFYLLPSRAWELAVGALLAIAIEKSMLVKIQQNRMLSQNLSYAGLVLILLGFFVIKEDTPFPGAYALFPTIGSALIIGFANSSNVVGKLLSLRPFTLIGLISYSAYMWHQPIFAFYKHLSLSTDSNIHKYVLAVLILPLSYLSWKYVENPFRNKAKFSRKFIFIFSTIGSVLFVAIGYWGVINKGFPDRAVNEKLEYLDYNADNRKLKLNSWVNVREAEKRFNEGSWFNSADSLPNLLLIGNSHSKDMYNTFLSSEEVQPKFEFARFEGEMRDLAKEKSPLYTSANYKQADVVMIVTHFYQEDLAFIEPLVERLLSDDKKVVLVKEIYKSTTINARTLADISIQEFLRDESARSDTSNIRALVNKVNKQYYDGRIDDEDLLRSKSDEIIDSIKQKHQEVVVLNRNDYAYDEDREICFALDMRLRKYFYDQRHNSLQGSKFFGKRIDKIKWLDPVYKLVDEVGKVNRVREDSVD